ncbi:MAG: carboxypeptidase-like regulatory domain-containing protein [Bacteroidetes bacterium]|nr:carboxypeptidase-like regulatory domain-containing protein [Bacteroidota bacterium]
MKLFFFLMIVLLGYQETIGQKIIKGIVVDSITLNAVPSASVRVKNTTRGTITNANGVFSIKAFGNDTLIFTSVGYDELHLPVFIDEDVMFVKLTQHVTMLKEVTIIGRPEAEKKELPSLKLRSKSTPFSGATPSSGFGASVNLAYFSKAEKEKRTLARINRELTQTQTYAEIVTNSQIKSEIQSRFSLSDSTYYTILTHFNERHREITHSGKQGEILSALFSFFETECRLRRH